MASEKYDYYYYFRFRLTGTSIRSTIGEKKIIKIVSIRNLVILTPEIVYAKRMKSFCRESEDVEQ